MTVSGSKLDKYRDQIRFESQAGDAGRSGSSGLGGMVKPRGRSGNSGRKGKLGQAGKVVYMTEEGINELYEETHLALESPRSNSFSVSPNPSTRGKKVTIRTDEQFLFNEVHIPNKLGRLRHNFGTANPTSTHTFRISRHLEPGLYRLVIFGEGSKSSIPLTID